MVKEPVPLSRPESVIRDSLSTGKQAIEFIQGVGGGSAYTGTPEDEIGAARRESGLTRSRARETAGWFGVISSEGAIASNAKTISGLTQSSLNLLN